MVEPCKILLTEPEGFPEEAERLLQQAGAVVRGPFSGAQLHDQIADCTVLFVRLGHNIDKNLLEKASGLKAVVTATTGLNHIDLDYCKENDIAVLSLKGETDFLETISPTADLTFGLILSLMRNIPAAAAHTEAGNWDRDLFKGYDLRGKTLGVYGCGRVGRKVARMALAFDMNVVAYDIAPPDFGHVQFVDEDTLLAKSDIVSLHIPYEKTLYSFFNAKHFARMKDKAFFINTARGELIDETHLLAALNSGKLAGAALDVLDGEYNANKDWVTKNPLIAYAGNNNNLIITPHIGGASHDSMVRVENFMAAKLVTFLGIA